MDKEQFRKLHPAEQEAVYPDNAPDSQVRAEASQPSALHPAHVETRYPSSAGEPHSHDDSYDNGQDDHGRAGKNKHRGTAPNLRRASRDSVTLAALPTAALETIDGNVSVGEISANMHARPEPIAHADADTISYLHVPGPQNPDQAQAHKAGGGVRRAKAQPHGVHHPGPGPAPRDIDRVAARLPAIGDSVHHYEVIREIGRGGMGAVFLARDTRLGRLVAIKFVTVTKAHIAARFIAEARTTARCNHENIVVIYEVGDYCSLPYIVLEYIEGQSLRDLMNERLRQAGREPERSTLIAPQRTAALMVPVVRALERAHGMGIVHRDLKPENIMITRSGAVKVLDFGIAKVMDEAGPANEGAPAARRRAMTSHDSGPLRMPASMTKTGSLIGTMPYMAPEQLSAGAIDYRVDLWAAGIMMCEMITGSHPLAPLDIGKFEQMQKLEVPMPRMGDICPQAGLLGQVIDRCLIKDKVDRLASASELAAELDTLLASRHPRNSAAEAALHETPFSGLAAYQEADADHFYGRDAEIIAVAERVRKEPVVAVIGPSGIGKSSLIRAGVIPTLKRSGEGWVTFVIRPGRAPLDALAELLDDLTGTTTETGGTHSSGASAESSATGATSARQRLIDEPGYLGATMRAWAHRRLRRVLVFVDQFEELYTLAEEKERGDFLTCLLGVADDAASPLRVLFSMRSEFLEHMAENATFASAASRALVFLTALERAGLREALTRPVEDAGYAYESDDIVDGMLDILQDTPGALPLLQFAAHNLWEARDRKRSLLTRESYEKMGGISGALARQADAVLAGMTSQRFALARRIFERLVTPERTRAMANVSELHELSNDAAMVEQVLNDLIDARLLHIEGSGDDRSLIDSAALRHGHDPVVEIVHESLIEGWPVLRRWLDSNREDAAFLAQLRTAAREWERSKRASDLLWRGKWAEDARHMRERYRDRLVKRERDYLDAVVRLASRAARLRRNAIVGCMALLVMLVIAGAYVIVKNNEKNHLIQAKNIALENALDEKAASLEEAQQARLEAENQRAAAELARDRAQTAKTEAEEAKRSVEIEKAKTEEALRSVEIEKAKTEGALRQTQAAKTRADALAEAYARASADARNQAEAERLAREQADASRRRAEAAAKTEAAALRAMKRARDEERRAKEALAERERQRKERLRMRLKGTLLEKLRFAPEVPERPNGDADARPQSPGKDGDNDAGK